MRIFKPVVVNPSATGKRNEVRNTGWMTASVAFVALSACQPHDQTTTKGTLAKVEADQRARAEDDGMILCAKRDAALTRSCTVEQSQRPDGLILTVRHPDGGFRRLLATRDGRGVVAADGAEAAQVSIAATDGIDVALGEDHYRLPATVKR